MSFLGGLALALILVNKLGLEVCFLRMFVCPA